jgi:type I restriction enzyme M protein
MGYEGFGYCLANPPFGVDWKKVQKAVTDEHKQRGRDGRFGPGLPRVSDGSLLFLMHLLSKRRHDATGTRTGIILNGSPLFTGGAGSGESEIRCWILENDWLEALVALPTDLFYNTGIATHVWVLTNRKERSLSAPEKKLLQKQLGEHDPEAEICKVKGAVEPDPDLRDYENVPLAESVQDYFAREVTPHVPDAWIDESKRDGQDGIVRYEINFNRHFYKYIPPRPLEEIDAELKQVEREIMALLGEVTEDEGAVTKEPHRPV